MKFKGYKILSCNQLGVGVFGGADYVGEKNFFVNAPCDVIFTQWGIFSCACPLKVHVKDILVYANAVI